MRKRIEAHVGACSDCRAELTALERTGVLLDSAGAQEAPAGTWEAVRLRISERPRARVRARMRWEWAMGAVALVALVLAVFLARPPAAQEPVVVIAVEADEEMQATMDGHLSAVWAAPLSDVAGVGLRMATLEDGG
jgi:predicted anti-sigma-YlaC factor YlaD